jgi:tetratricopeptide (TPR) repeat protein
LRKRRSIEQLGAALELEPYSYLAHLWLAVAYILAGKTEDGIRILRIATQLWGQTHFFKAELALGYAKEGRIDEARKLLDQLHALAVKTYVPAIDFSLIYFGIGEIEKCFDWLEKAVEEPIGYRLFHHIHSTFDPLRSHPRYHALLRKMNLEP